MPVNLRVSTLFKVLDLIIELHSFTDIIGWSEIDLIIEERILDLFTGTGFKLLCENTPRKFGVRIGIIVACMLSSSDYILMLREKMAL